MQNSQAKFNSARPDTSPDRSPRRLLNGCSGRTNRRGNQIVEMALGFSVLCFMTMGMVEFGQYFYIKHCFESAIRDGGRYAVLPTATQAQTLSTITSTLAEANVTFHASWLTITDLTAGGTVTDVSQVAQGDQLQFTLSTTYASISNAVRPLYAMTGQGIGSSKMLTAMCIMVKE
jgi:Flp pilus assembly protein TadG